MSGIRLSVIVPIYGGAAGLPEALQQLAEFQRAQAVPTELVLVDDGSAPPVAGLLARFARTEPGVVLLRNPCNMGKGHAVARGLEAARGRLRVFTDVDLAYPVGDVARIARELEAGADVAVGCRVLPASRYIMSAAFFHYLYTRHLMSRVYNSLVRWLLIPGILDSQAGLKGMTAAAAELLVPKLTIAGFAFDVELLYLASRCGLAIRQVPVTFRYDDEPTTVRLLRDGARMVRDIGYIRWRAAFGQYGDLAREGVGIEHRAELLRATGT